MKSYDQNSDTAAACLRQWTVSPKSASGQKGFALIASLAIMALLVILSISLFTLSTVSLKSATTSLNQERARANAQLALMMALGQLQKHAGPDRRVSGHAALTGDPSQNPHWTGIWSTDPDAPLPVWLVSGNESYALDNLNLAGEYPEAYFTPEDPPDQNWFTFHNSTQAEEIVRVPTVGIEENGKTTTRYAWWISDEGTKARVDVENPDTESPSTIERVSISQVPRQNSLRHVDTRFSNLSPLAAAEDRVDSRRILTLDTIEILDGATAAPGLSGQYFHDLTIGGYGLPVNVVEGGMKTDLSIAFDSSQNTQGYDVEIMGATPVLVTNGKNPGYDAVYNFSPVSEPSTFYLIPELSDNGNFAAGPNWGNLFNYCQLWQNVNTGMKSIIPLSIPTNKVFNEEPVDSDLRTNDWAPYRRHSSSTGRRDSQHTNSAVNPALSMIQVGFRLASEKDGDGFYEFQLQIKPLIGLWNPYNVAIDASHYGFRWGLYPYIRLGVETPDGSQYEYTKWLREELPKGGEGDKIWEMRTTDKIDLQPGEILLLSVGRKRSGDLYNFGDKYQLVNQWDQKGYLKSSSFSVKDASGSDVKIPVGSKVWVKELMLLDVQKPEAWDEITGTFNDGDPWIADGNTASFFALSADGGDFHRISDLWQTPLSTVRDQLPYLVPEPILEDSLPLKMPVELIEYDKRRPNSFTPLEIGTWRFFTRNAYDANDTQKLRGWVDTNPRFVLANPLWDGSKPVGSAGYEGWHFPSAFIGDNSNENPIDGGPPGRGQLVGPTEPDANLDGGRYQGYGGFSSASIGQTHVPIFDIPRSPLVSLGQLQHAQFSRYQYEPTLPFGNSYASTRIPLNQIKVNEYMGMENFTMYDISYGLNEALWDKYFFSTIGRDYFVAPPPEDEEGVPLDSVLNFEQVASGEQVLPNPRHSFHPQSGDSSFAQLLQNADEETAPFSLAARIGIDGAFNVNSTSVDAWKAVLSSMADFEFPVISTDGQTISWADPEGIRLPRFGHVLSSDGWNSGEGPQSKEFWQGYRKISEDELDSLAQEIVREVRQRGPFRSFADFVNRDPDGEDVNHQRKGALQAALDSSVNAPLSDEVGPAVVDRPVGVQFSDAFNGESQAGGFASYILQGDILQSLAPILQVRSDYFRIRAVGQTLDPNGAVVAQAACEAYVQRVADYIDDGADGPEVAADDLSSSLNQMFGRHYEIASFRWLSPDEL